MKGLFHDPLKIMKQIKNDRNVFRLREKGLLWANVIHLRRGWQTGSEINEVLSDLPKLRTAIMWNIVVSKKGGRCWHLLVCRKTRTCISSGVTPQVRPSRCRAMREWIGKEGWRRKAGTLTEGCCSTQMSYKHHLAHSPSHRKGSQDSGVQVQSRKWDLFPRKSDLEVQ